MKTRNSSLSKRTLPVGGGLLLVAVACGLLAAFPESGAARTAKLSASPSLSIVDVTANEGASGTTALSFKVSLSRTTRDDVKVRYATVDGTATAPGDYQAISGTLTIKSGKTSGTVTVRANGDTAAEQDEQLTVNLSAPTRATIADGTGVGTIVNDDLSGAPSDPAISISEATVIEGDLGTVNAVFTVTLGATSPNTVTVDYSTFDGSAAAPEDYAATSGTLTFTPGQSTKQIVVPVNGDTAIETTETFTVNLTNPVNGAVGGDGIGTGRILNDDALPSLSIANVTGAEGNSGTVNAVFAVTLSAASSASVTVDYSTFDGTADQPGDYQAASGTLTFSPGQTNKAVIVAVNGDTTIETNETFTVALSKPTNATISGNGIGTGTITNDDALPTLSIGNATVEERNSGTVNAVFAVTLSAASSNTVTIDYSTFDGSAVAPGDYVATSGTLTFTPGQTLKHILVPVRGDTLNEVNEAYTVSLSNAVNATISDGVATGTITNDDAVPTLSINSVTLPEGNSGTTSFTFTVTLSAASGLPVTVDFATADGSATAPGDYEAQTGTLTFSPGQTTKTITVLVNGDTSTEGSETFTVVLSNPVNATVAAGSGPASGTGTGTITNDD